MRMKHKPWAEPFLLSHPEFVITLETFKNDDVQEFLNKENGFPDLPLYEEGENKGLINPITQGISYKYVPLSLQ